METNAAGYDQHTCLRWSPELIAQFPLPDTYEWIEGDGCSYPHLRFRGEIGWDTRWVYDTSARLVVTYPPYSMIPLSTYSVQSHEEAIALIYNLCADDRATEMPPELRAELVLPGSRYAWRDEDADYYLSVLDDAYMGEIERVEHTFDDEGTLLVVWFGFNNSVDKPLKYSTKNVDEACRLIYALFMTGT